MKNTSRRKPSELGIAGFYTEKSALIRDGVLKLATRVQENKKKYDKNTVLITGCNTGNGATMIAVNLAITMAQSGMRTLLIDTDLYKGSIHDNGLSDFFLLDTNITQVVRASNISNLDFVPRGVRMESPALFLGSEKMAGFIRKAKAFYDYVIVDCAPITTSPDALALLFEIDGIALICSLNNTSKMQLKKAKSIIEPYADKYYGVVVNSLDEKHYKRLYT